MPSGPAVGTPKTQRKYREQGRAAYWKRKDTGWVRRFATLASYGLTEEDYNAMLRAQENRCAACERESWEVKRGLFVDHCHKTGRVRGLLCSNCNTAIGLASDDPARLRALADYLDGDDHE